MTVLSTAHTATRLTPGIFRAAMTLLHPIPLMPIAPILTWSAGENRLRKLEKVSLSKEERRIPPPANAAVRSRNLRRAIIFRFFIELNEDIKGRIFYGSAFHRFP